MSLTDVEIKGTVDFKPALDIVLITQRNDMGIQVESVNMEIRDMTINIDSFKIDAIRLGQSPGEGTSLGSVGIYNMTGHVTGNVRLNVNN